MARFTLKTWTTNFTYYSRGEKLTAPTPEQKLQSDLSGETKSTEILLYVSDGNSKTAAWTSMNKFLDSIDFKGTITRHEMRAAIN
jgi:hypothetical protein